MANQWRSIQSRNEKKLHDIGRVAFITMVNGVILKSPVDKGTFINSWLFGINKPNESVSSVTFGDNRGTARVSDAVKGSDGYNIGDKMFLTNPQPYGPRLEYEAWSKKAKAGMLRITLAQWPSVTAKLARKFKNDKQ